MKNHIIISLLILSVGYSQNNSVDVSKDSTKESQQMFNKQSMIVEDGLQTEWYKNGKKKAEGNFKDGKVFFLLI